MNTFPAPQVVISMEEYNHLKELSTSLNYDAALNHILDNAMKGDGSIVYIKEELNKRFARRIQNDYIEIEVTFKTK